MLLSPTVRSQTSIEWVSTISESWNNSSNWNPMNVPNVATEYAQFGNATNPNNRVGIATAITNVGAIETLSTRTANMTLYSSGTGAGATHTLTLAGVAINSIANTILRNNSSFTLTIQPNIAQANASVLEIALGNNTNNVVNIDGSGGINVGVAISGAGRDLIFNGNSTGQLTFSGTQANTYTGTTSVNVGQLNLNKTSVNAIAGGLIVGDGIGVANTANVVLQQSNQITDSATVTVNGDGRLNMQTFDDTVGTVVLSGGAITGTSGVLTGSSYDVRSGTIDAILGGNTAALTKSTTGTVNLSRANTYGGGTSVTAGTLLITNTTGSATGSGAVSVGNTGTLTGTGVINSGANTITINGILSPGLGAAAGNVGTINLASTAGAGALTLSSTSTLMFDLGTSKDLVVLTSTGLALGGGTLALSLGPGFNYANTYTLFSGVNGQSGSFGTVTGYDTGSYAAVFNYTGTDYNISFTPVPEPSTWIAGALAVGALGYSQRKSLQKRRMGA